MPDGMDAAQRDFGQAVAAHLAMSADNLDGDQARGEAIYRATAALPMGPQVLAWRLGEDIDYLGISMTHEQALEDLFGRRADRLCAENGLRLDPIPQTKNGFSRIVPVHSVLEAEGFVRFVQAASDGFLFAGDVERIGDQVRSAQELRAAELAVWIRKKANLEAGLSPNHSWRHTFITKAEAAGISKRHSNAITGHNKIKDASDGYVSPDIKQLKHEIEKLSVFEVE